MIDIHAFKKVYVCSPLRADTREGIVRNMEKALFYMQLTEKIFNTTAVAPHAFLPIFLDDNVPLEREFAMNFCLNMIPFCDVLVVVGNKITSGMQREIDRAKQLGIAIIRLDIPDEMIPPSGASVEFTKVTVKEVKDGAISWNFGSMRF